MRKQFIIAVISALCLSSCFCDKHLVGSIDPYEPLVHVASVHHAHFLGGIGVNKDRVTNELPGVENYVIESKHTFGDILGIENMQVRMKKLNCFCQYSGQKS